MFNSFTKATNTLLLTAFFFFFFLPVFNFVFSLQEIASTFKEFMDESNWLGRKCHEVKPTNFTCLI